MIKTSQRKEPHSFLNISCNSYVLPLWQTMDPAAQVMLFDVSPTSGERKVLVDKFHETLQTPEFQIQRIMRIQNPVLWLHYFLKRKQMKQEFGASFEENELHLFHGTYRDRLESIVKQGLDWRRERTHGKMLGLGSYFASQANGAHEFTDCGGDNISTRRKSKANQPTQSKINFPAQNSKIPQFLNQPFISAADRPAVTSNSSSICPQQLFENGTADVWSLFNKQVQPASHFIIVARVLVGRYTVGETGLHLPPPMDESNPYLRYDSCVDNMENPKTYAIFDHNQAYPEYIIEYQQNVET